MKPSIPSFHVAVHNAVKPSYVPMTIFRMLHALVQKIGRHEFLVNSTPEDLRKYISN